MVILKIWNKETIPVALGKPKPPYEIEIEHGDVLDFVNENDDTLLYIEVGPLMDKLTPRKEP